ncbi:hypothetical protein ABV409_08480 [Flagellimonas sp. DF-77]|uniref:hypothetical protein n=1 Tax=Flagellimonas algarum TaxID=3230298 RepID=UPI003391EDCE
MNYLNPEIERRVKSRKKSLIRPTVSCGIFQETDSTPSFSNTDTAQVSDSESRD